MIVILLGPPGVGKGTQAKVLAGRHGMSHVSTGDMIRAEIAAGSPLGAEARRYLDQGNLVPDQVILGMVEDRIRQDPEEGILFDGFPRTIAQAEGLDERLARLERKIDAVISIAADEEALVERLGSRRTCPVDGRVYNLLSQKPRTDGRCDDHPETALVLRSDDEPETVRHRLKVYREQTKPLVDYYRARHLLKEVDGLGTVDEVTGRIEAALK